MSHSSISSPSFSCRTSSNRMIPHRLHSSPPCPITHLTSIYLRQAAPRRNLLSSARAEAGAGAGRHPLYSADPSLRPSFSLPSWGNGGKDGVLLSFGGDFGGHGDLPNCGGGGGGDGPEGEKAGDGDGEDASKELGLRPLRKRKHEVVASMGLDAAALESVLADNVARAWLPFIRRLLKLLYPISGVLGMCGPAVACIKDDMTDSTASDSSSSTGANNGVRDDSTHFSGSYIDETDGIRPANDTLASSENGLQPPMDFIMRPETVLRTMLSMVEKMQNDMAINQVGSSNGNNNSALNKKEGFLECIHTVSANLFVACLSLFFGLSYAYPLAPKSELNFGDKWMQVITTGSLVTLFSSFIASSLSSYLKTSKSVDGSGFQIFTWLLLFLLVSLYAVICTALRFCAKILQPDICSIGTIGTCLILFGWVYAFYILWPKILQDVNEGNVGDNEMVPQRSDSKHAEYLKEWTKGALEKIGSYLGLRGSTRSSSGLPT